MRHLELAYLVKEGYDRKDAEVANIEFIYQNNVFVFRGTDEWRDVVTDIRFIPYNLKGIGLRPIGWCPKGFARAAWKVADAIEHLLMPEPIVLTGHSLGGAIALLVGAILCQRRYPIEEIVTFGAPRVGALPLLDSTPVTMYKQGRDIVTTVPPYLPHCRKQTQLGNAHSWRIGSDHFFRRYVREIKNG